MPLRPSGNMPVVDAAPSPSRRIWAKAPYTSVWRVVTGLDTPRRLTTRYSFNGPRPQDSP
jgi:hypothetical protein